jgi:hypothetical protein
VGAEILQHLVMGLATVCCNIAVSCPQALFFWDVKNNTTEHIFYADNAFFYLYLQVCDFPVGKRTVPHEPFTMKIRKFLVQTNQGRVEFLVPENQKLLGLPGPGKKSGTNQEITRLQQEYGPSFIFGALVR